MVAAQSRKTALSVGLHDRGLIAPGYKADVNVIDYDRLHLHPPKVHYDLPVGGRRLLQQVDGYDATIVSGVVTQREGRATGARPGKLVRGAQGSRRSLARRRADYEFFMVGTAQARLDARPTKLASWFETALSRLLAMRFDAISRRSSCHRPGVRRLFPPHP